MEENKTYVHEEFFTVHDIIIGSGILILLVLASLVENMQWAVVLTHSAVFLLLFFWFFLNINISIGHKYLILFFNTPIFEKRIPYSSIDYCEIKKGGYNTFKELKTSRFPLGFPLTKKVLKIHFKEARKKPFIIGLKKPKNLKQLIEQHL